MDAISSLYTNNQLTTDTSSTKSSKLQDSLSKDLNNATDDELMNVCKDFESYFVEQIFKEMQKTIPEEDNTSSYSSSLKDYYTDELTQEYASAATKGEGVGLAQTLYEQMKRNYAL